MGQEFMKQSSYQVLAADCMQKAILASLPFYNNLENMYLKLSQVPYMYNAIITT